MDLQIAFERLITLLSDVTFVPVAVGLVVVVTQVIKNVFALEGKWAAFTALSVQVIVWVVYSILKARGLDGRFEEWVTGAETIIRTLVSILFPALLSVGGAQYAYNKLAASAVPGFRGDERIVTKTTWVTPELDGKQP